MAAMEAEAAAAIATLRPGEVVDVYDWMRNLAMRIAMRALLGLDPTRPARAPPRPSTSSAPSATTGSTSPCACCAGRARPGARWSPRARSSTRSSSARSPGAAPSPTRIAATSSASWSGPAASGGEAFTDREIRDQVMTLMFAGHDTSTSTLTFMLHELARHPDVVARLVEEQDRVLGGAVPDVEQLEREMPYLDMVLDEVLRLYPPAWIGPRRAVRDFEFGGYTVPARRLRQLLLLGQPPHPRGLPRARGLHPRALHPRAQGGAAARRLRPLRRRPADLHRQALRPDRGEAGGDDAAAAPAPRRAARAAR